MLQKSLLFLHTADEDKNKNEEMELSSNNTSPSSYSSTVFTICFPISILGLIGNGIIFGLLCCTIKKTKFTVYVANLAAADFFAMLHEFIGFVDFFTPHVINTRAGILILIIFFFGHNTNSYFLAAMSTERCLTVFSPVWYQSHRRKCSTELICAILWTLSVMLSVLDHFLCSPEYISALNIGTSPCTVETVFNHTMTFIIFIPSMVFSTLALCIRMKRKPQQHFPARLDITIWVIVVLHLIFYPVTAISSFISFFIPFRYELEFYYLTMIFYCIGSSVNPFVYLLVGCWKWEKGQEPCYMFLERALRDERKGRMRTPPDQEQA